MNLGDTRLGSEVRVAVPAGGCGLISARGGRRVRARVGRIAWQALHKSGDQGGDFYGQGRPDPYICRFGGLIEENKLKTPDPMGN